MIWSWRREVRLQRRAAELAQQAQQMARMGRYREALPLQQEELGIARELARLQPEDPRWIRAVAGALYNMAISLTNTDRPDSAIEALEEAEQKYRALGDAGVPQAGALVADVLARKGLVQSARGHGASAVMDLNAAVTAYRELVDEPLAGVHWPDMARVLAMNANILRAYGDPDMAATSADIAIRLCVAGQRAGAATDTVMLAHYWAIAADVASEIHAAQGRIDIALAADHFAIETARSLMAASHGSADVNGLARALIRKGLHLAAAERHDEAKALLDEGQSLEPSTARQVTAEWDLVKSGNDANQVTVASSLAAAARELGSERTSLSASLTRLSTETAFGLYGGVTPSDRCSPQLVPAFAQELADVGVALLPTRRAEGLRLALEAHYLFAAASRMRTLAMRFNLSGFGGSWARALLACSRVYEEMGQLGMALDLASWSGGLALQMMLVIGAERALIRDCIEQHGRMLIATGDRRGGEDVLRHAANL